MKKLSVGAIRETAEKSNTARREVLSTEGMKAAELEQKRDTTDDIESKNTLMDLERPIADQREVVRKDAREATESARETSRDAEASASRLREDLDAARTAAVSAATAALEADLQLIGLEGADLAIRVSEFARLFERQYEERQAEASRNEEARKHAER